MTEKNNKGKNSKRRKDGEFDYPGAPMRPNNKPPKDDGPGAPMRPRGSWQC